MKKIVVFLMILACVCSTLNFKKSSLFDLEGVERVCFISEKNYQNEEISTVECGNKFFNYCSFSTAKRNIENWKNDLDGIQFYYKDTNLEQILKNLKFQQISEQKLDNLQIFYGFTPYYSDCIVLEGKKINVQIVVSEEGTILAGFPVVLTGY